MAPTGQYLSSPHTQSRGAPQGGVLSPLMWLFLVNRLPERTRSQMRITELSMVMDVHLLIQISADDISVALRGRGVADIVTLAEKLGEILRKVLREKGLSRSQQKCKNFILQLQERALKMFKRGDPASRWHEGKEKVGQQAIRNQDQRVESTQERGKTGPPFKDVPSFKLLGLTLDNALFFLWPHAGNQAKNATPNGNTTESQRY